MLTPYLLVVVSTTPVAQTQHKSARPKEVAAHSALTGCLAWFPAVKLKVPDPVTGSQISKVKLAYCWSNVLTVLEVDEIPPEDKDKPPSLKFKARSRWKSEEAIVAVQWLSRSVLTVLTITQRLIVLEDRTMRMTEGFDLIHKFIYHVDVFSKQLHNLVEQFDEEDTSMHGVVADAFYMSFKSYKGRLFLLGFNDVSIGALSNWADRLIALMENGDYIGAIQLATSYYTGDADKLTIGLPEDTILRHSMVRDKLTEIMSASLKYAFSQRQKSVASADDNHLQELAEVCFVACQSLGDIDFLFDEMYEWFEDASLEWIFLETLEPYILDGTITAVPPRSVKALVTHFVSKGMETRLEEMLCHMNTATLDLDQVTQLCKQHGLYDALIYVWNQAMHDFITPLIDLLALLVPNRFEDGNRMEDGIYSVNAVKMFPYLSYILTGRVYPNGDQMDDDVAVKAKAELYWFLFSGKSITWPKGSSKRFLTRPEQSEEPSFPYLRMILAFDASSFLSAINEAFEDTFLNDSPEKQLNGGARGDLPEEQIFGLTVDRQYVVSILMEIMNPSDFPPEDTIYLDMFIARNLSKYPQYLLFPGTTLTKVLTGLCNYPGQDLAEDAQLSAEYLLSVYHPSDMPTLMPLFRKAGFYRILKRTYQVDKQFGKLIEAYFEDPDDRHAIFTCVETCLRPQTGLSKRQTRDVYEVLKEHAHEYISLDPASAATSLNSHAAELHRDILDSAVDEPRLQYAYLKAILEPEEPLATSSGSPDHGLVEQYVQLMCKFEPSHVSGYVELVQSANLRLENLLPTMEDTGVIDAAVMLMARAGQVQEAMDRLIQHLGTLESALQGLLTGHDGSDEADLQSSAEELIQALQKYSQVGIWLCQGQTKIVRENSGRRGQRSPNKEAMTSDEVLWLDLIDTSVQITRRVSAMLESQAASQPNGDTGHEDIPSGIDREKLIGLIRMVVQQTFTALLSSTATPVTPHAGIRIGPGPGSNLSFLRVLRAFLSRAATTAPTLADLRAVLASIFSAYAYEESILRLSNRLLDRSLFVSVTKAVELRQRGWRPKGSTCEACGRRVWGPGAVGNVFGAWEEKQEMERRHREERRAHLLASASSSSSSDRGKGKDNQGNGHLDEHYDGKGKGKGKGKEPAPSQPPVETLSKVEGSQDQVQDTNYGLKSPASPFKRDAIMGPLVVLACRHIYHQSCLDMIQLRDGRRRGHQFGKEREYRCPIDG
jgi:hypothetical protein